MDTSLKQQLKDIGYVGEFDLSSLVEASGDGTVLSYFKSHSICTNPSRNIFSGIEYSTPEEAVANLWLELNKKQ